MNSCQPYADRLIDLVYELLDEEETRAVQRHVDSCPDCSSRVDRLVAEQKLLAKAAKIYRQVPAFEKPTIPIDVAGRRESARQTVVPPKTAAPHRTIPRWLGWAVAAAILLALGISYGMYQGRLAALSSDLEAARGKLAKLDADIADAVDQLQQGKKQLPEKLKEEVVQMVAIGPATLRPGQRQAIRVKVEDFSGAPAFARLTARLVDKQGQRELFKSVATAANGSAEIPLTIPEKILVRSAELQLTAATAYTRCVLTRPVTIGSATYRLHLSLNKPAFHAGELMFFRVVALDAFTHRPPEAPLRLYAALIDSRGNEVQRWIGISDDYGIAAGELALPASLPAGRYNLTVRSLDDDDNRVLAARQYLSIRRVDQPELALAGAAYFPGETIEAVYRLPRNAAEGRRSRKISVELVPAEKKAREKRRPLAKGTIPTAKKTDMPVRLTVPREARPGRYELAVGDGMVGLRLRQPIVVLPVPAIELRAEGGNPVADVPNRVYFRVVVPKSERGDPSLKIIDPKGTLRRAIAAKHRIDTARTRVYLGSFDLTPRPQQRLFFEATLPGKPAVRKPLPEIAPTGAALRVANVVDREDKPVHATIYSSGRGRRVLVTVSRDGNVIDQQELWATVDGTKTTLAAPLGTSAVTVYELQPGGAVPMAERLVYRAPSRYLELNIHAEAKADGRLHVDVHANDESQRAANARLGLNVSDERVMQTSGDLPVPLPAFILLGGSPPFDLESSVLFLREDDKSAKHLEYFLSIDGWRRFGRIPGDGPQLVRGPMEETQVFIADNREQAERTYRKRLKSALESLVLKTVDRHQQLAERRESEARRVAALAAAVEDYRRLPERYLMAAAGILLLGALTVGIVLLMYGGYRMLLRRESPTGAFATAFAMLLLCVVVYGVSRQWSGLPASGDGGSSGIVDRTPPPVPAVDVDRVVDLYARRDTVQMAGTLKLAHPRPQRPDIGGGATVAKSIRLEESKMAAADLATDLPVEFSAADFLGISHNARYVSARNRQAMLSRLLKKTVRSSPLMTPDAKGAVPPRVRPGAAVPSVPPPGGAIPTPGGQPEAASKDKKGQASGTGAFAPKLGMARGAGQHIDGRYFRIFSQPSDYRYRQSDGTPLSWGTLLWLPKVRCRAGRYSTAVDVPAGKARYRVMVVGHTRDGRLGFAVRSVSVKARR